MKHKEFHGFAYALLAAVMSATTAVFVKYVDGVPFESVVFIRFFVAFLFVLPAIFRGKVHLHLKFVPKHIVRGLMGLGGIYCYFYSVSNLPLVSAVTLSNMTPLFMPLVVFFWLKLIIPRARVFAIVLGFLGVIVILRPGVGVQELSTVVGVVGALFSAFAIVWVRQLSKSESTETILAYYFLISMAALAIPMIITWEPISNPMNWLYLILIGIASIIYQYALTMSLTHAPATKVSALSYLSVVFGGLFGWWLFGEIPSLWIIGGVALIIAGGVISLLSKESARHRKN